MKYAILGFQQSKLIELGLKTDDALVLRTIKDMYSSSGIEFIIENNEKYMWINYSYMIEQIPIIGTKRNLTNKISNYERLELIKRVLKHKRQGQKGNFAYISITPKLDELQDYDPYEKFSQGLGKNFVRVTKNFPNKDSSIKDSSIKDIYIVQSEELWHAYPSKKGKANAMKKIPKLIQQYGYEQMLRTIERYIQDVEYKRNNGFKTLQYKNGSTFFNSGYVDYLDENYTEHEEEGSCGVTIGADGGIYML